MTSNVPARVGDLPSYMVTIAAAAAAKGDNSLQTMQHHRVLNRLAIVQSMTPRERKEKFGEGSIYIPATETRVIARGESIDIVPVMFYDEFVTWGDRKDTTGAKIRERSIDRASILAAKAGDFNRRIEKYGDKLQFEMRHVHHMNFLCVVYSGDLKGTLCVVSYSKGDFKKGMSWIGAIQMRKIQGVQAPLWSTVWRLSVGDRKNDKGEWYGIDIGAPDVPWIQEEDAKQLETLHHDLLKEYKAQMLLVGHEAAEGESPEENLTGNQDF